MRQHPPFDRREAEQDHDELRRRDRLETSPYEYGRFGAREHEGSPRQRPFDDLEEWQRPWYQAQRDPRSSRGDYGEPGRDPYPGRYPPQPGPYGDPRGGYAGRGPKDYRRSDERLREDVCDRLTDHPQIDAYEISVRVHEGEVTLEGSVPERAMKRMAEDCAESVSGVHDVHNQIRVGHPNAVPRGENAPENARAPR